MEDILDVYELPYDEKHPVVCMDEKPYQLLGEIREPLPMIPGSDQKTDSEYVRNGTVSIFAFVEPLGGVHHVSVREHRTARLGRGNQVSCGKHVPRCRKDPPCDG